MYSLIIKICKLVKDTSRHNLQYELVVTQDFVNEIFALLSQPNHSRGGSSYPHTLEQKLLYPDPAINFGSE